jgi:hypothetical protein
MINLCHLLAVVASLTLSGLVRVSATPSNGGEFDSFVSPREATFVRSCYPATGASLRGGETVSNLTVLFERRK